MAMDTRSGAGPRPPQDRGRSPSGRISPTTAAWPIPPACRTGSPTTQWPSTRLHAAVAIEPLLQRHLADEVVDADVLRLLHHAVDLDRPRPQLERLRRLGDGLGGAELVEIVVVVVGPLVGDGTVEQVFLVALERV